MSSAQDRFLEVGHLWRFREKIELEAADLFSRLTRDLALTGASKVLIDLARQAADDERVHAQLCRETVEHHAPGLEPVQPVLGAELGPPSLSLADRALYTSVAMSCVTETLSAALLLEIRKHAEPAFGTRVVKRILEDEIGHSRLGWAHLAEESSKRDVSWITSHVPAMLRAALFHEIKPTFGNDASREVLRRYGMLPAERANELIQEAIEGVIVPGFSQFGLKVSLDLSCTR